jgi:hypothetical protein
MDVVGDWSVVRLTGLIRRVFHWTEHPSLEIDGEWATAVNEGLNLRLVELVGQRLGLAGVGGKWRKSA